MIRIIAVIILIYLIFRVLRIITVFAMRSRSVQEDESREPEKAPKQAKLIPKDEGEYVDFEEVKK